MGRPPHPGAPPHPLGWRQLLPLAGGVGRRVPVTTSPRLELELSPDLLCGQRGKWSREQRGGCEGGGSCSLTGCPSPLCGPHSPAPRVRPRATLCPQNMRSTLGASSWLAGLSRGWECPAPSQTPGAEAVLAQLLFLQQAQAVQFDRAGDEANLTALLHQSPDPPVIIVFLQTTTAGGVGETKKEIRGQASSQLQGIPPPTLPSLPRGWHPQRAPAPASEYSSQFSGLSRTSILLCPGLPHPKHIPVLRVLPPAMCQLYPGKAGREVNADTSVCLAHCHSINSPLHKPSQQPCNLGITIARYQ